MEKEKRIAGIMDKLLFDRKEKKVLPISSVPKQIFAGFINAFFVLVSCIAMGKILMVGELVPYNTIAVQTGLLGCFVTEIIIMIFSNYTTAVVGLSSDCYPFYTAIIANLLIELEGDPESQFSTYLLVSLFVNLIATICSIGIAKLGIGMFVDFIPLYVRSGIFASFGWFMYKYNFSMTYPGGMSTKMFTDYNLWIFFIPHILGIILTAIKFSKYKHPLMIPIYFVVVIVVFYIVFFSANLDINTMRTKLFIMDESKSQPFYELYLNFKFHKMNWSLIGSNFVQILVMSLVGPVLNGAINVVMIGYTLQTPIDLVHESIMQCYHYMATFITGGYCSQYSTSYTTLNVSIGGTTLIASISVTVIIGVFLFIHWTFGIIGYIPRFALSGFFVHFGLDIFIGTFYRAKTQVRRHELFIMLCMVIFSIFLGLIYAILLGIGFAFLRYLYSSRKLGGGVALFSDGANIGTYCLRPLEFSKKIKKIDRKIQVVILYGSIFFASSLQITQQIYSKLLEQINSGVSTTHIVIDFSRVTTLDSTAYAAFCDVFGRIAQINIHVDLIFVKEKNRLKMLHVIKNQLLRSQYEIHSNLDEAISSCEDTLTVVYENDFVSTMSSKFVQEMRKAESKKLAGLINWASLKPIARLKKLIKVIVSIPQKQLRQSIYYFILNGKAKYVTLDPGNELYVEDKHTKGIFLLLNGKLTSYMGVYNEDGTFVHRNSLMIVESNKLWINKVPGTIIGSFPERTGITLNEDTVICDSHCFLLNISSEALLEALELDYQNVRKFSEIDRTNRKRKLKFLKSRVKEMRIAEIGECNNVQDKN